MFRVSAFLIATLLLFNAMPATSTQQNSVQAQAEADANSDMSDGSKAKWVLLGGFGSTVGCLLGCAGGYLLGAPNLNYFFRPIPLREHRRIAPSQVLCFSVFAPCQSVCRCIHTTQRPPERLLGKSPEYIETYTHAYKSRTASLRKICVTAGSIASNLSIMTTSVIIFSYGMGQHPVE